MSADDITARRLAERYEPVLAESCLSVHMTGKPILSVDAPEPRDVGL